MSNSEQAHLKRYLEEKAKQAQENRNLKLCLHLMLGC